MKSEFMSLHQAFLIHLQLKEQSGGAYIESCLAVKWQRNEWKSFYNTAVATDPPLQGPSVSEAS